MDFGIAKLVTSATQLTQTGFGIGTPAYMSPEQAQGLAEVGPEADIYALSVVLFELLTGRVPFDADTPVAVILKSIKDPLPMPRALSPDISEAIQAVIIKGTAKSPADRYTTVAELSVALEAALNESAREAAARTTLLRNAPTERLDEAAALAIRGGRFGWIAGVAAAVVLTTAAYFWIAREGVSPTPVPQPAVVQAPVASEEATVVASTTASVIDAGVLAFDRPVAGQIDHSGQRVDYAFDGIAGESVYFDHVRTTAGTRFVLIAPDGARMFETTSDHGPQALLQSGRYRLSAEAQGDARTEFEFTMWRLAEPAIDGGTIAPNVLIEGHTDLPGQIEQFRIDGKAGQQLTFVLDQASEVTDFRLVDPNGNRQIFTSDRDEGPIKLPRTGLYTLIADPRFDKPSRFEFTLRSPVKGRGDREPIATAGTAPATDKAATSVAGKATVPETVTPPKSTALGAPVVVTAAPSEPPQVEPQTVTAKRPGDDQAAPAAAPSSGGGLNQVTKGVTTQSDLLKLFGGPNLATVDPQGRDTWVYERTVTQTETRSATNAAAGGVDFSAFWSVGEASASASKSQTATTLSSGSSVHTVTVIVTFAPNRTVLDYTIKANYF
jgi:hypothetical protein